MRTSDPFTHLLDDPWAPHPVVNRHVCSGGGGGGGGDEVQHPNDVPSYKEYITAMTDIANKGQGWADELYEQAKKWGVDLVDLGNRVSGKAGAAADTQQAASQEGRDYWKGLSRPQYEAQAKEAMRMNADLPAYREQEAGRYGADAAVSIDAQKAALQRKMLADQTAGSRPGIASKALDTMAAFGRSQAITAAQNNARIKAGEEARKALADSLKSEEFLASEASDQAKLATANRGQESDVANKAAVAASSLYAPASTMYTTSADTMKEWGNATAKSYDQQLGGYTAYNKAVADANASEGDDSTASDIFGLVGGVGGAVAGSMFAGPAGTVAGASLGGSLGGSLGKSAGSIVDKAATGGKIMGRRVPRGYAAGGAIDTSSPNMVTPEMSPSGGEQVDDVPAMVSEGEFVIPERTVDWFGEKYFQNLIMKSDKDRETQTVAAPDIVPNDEGSQQAMDTSAPPAFRSEGARV